MSDLTDFKRLIHEPEMLRWAEKLAYAQHRATAAEQRAKEIETWVEHWRIEYAWMGDDPEVERGDLQRAIRALAISSIRALLGEKAKPPALPSTALR